MPPSFTKLNFNIYCGGVIWAHRLIPPGLPFVALIIFKFILKYVGLSSCALSSRSQSLVVLRHATPVSERCVT